MLSRPVTDELFPAASTPASAEFKLSITRALANQLADALGQLPPAPLTPEDLAALYERPGVYELYLHDHRVYVGKVSKDLPARPANHFRKLSERAGLSPTDVRFLWLYVD